jgi:hypothetical protein
MDKSLLNFRSPSAIDKPNANVPKSVQNFQLSLLAVALQQSSFFSNRLLVQIHQVISGSCYRVPRVASPLSASSAASKSHSGERRSKVRDQSGWQQRVPKEEVTLRLLIVIWKPSSSVVTTTVAILTPQL